MIHTLIYSFSNYLMSTVSVPNTVRGAQHWARTYAQGLSPHGVFCLAGEADTAQMAVFCRVVIAEINGRGREPVLDLPQRGEALLRPRHVS